MQFFVSTKAKIKEYFYLELNDQRMIGDLVFKELKELHTM